MIRIRHFFCSMIICLCALGCSNKSTTFEAIIIGIKDGNYLILQNGEIVDPVGFFIPKGGINYRSFMEQYLRKLVINKRATFKVIAKAKTDYPKYQLVQVEIDKTNLSIKIIKEGMAFFDHGYYPEKETYEELEKIARIKNKGVWAQKDKLKVLYIGSRGWNYIHYVDCPEVKRIKPEDKIFYYFFPPDIFYYRMLDLTCHYCANRYRDEGGKYSPE